MMAATTHNEAELEISKSESFGFVRGAAIDPFGLVPKDRSKQLWKQAQAIDTMFTRKTVTKGKDFGMGEMFYCADCDGFIKCTNSAHQSFIRCFGALSDHCLGCL